MIHADCFLHPLTAKAVPSPYKQGESAVRTVFTYIITLS